VSVNSYVVFQEENNNAVIFAKEEEDHHGDDYYSYVFSITLYVLFQELLGLILISFNHYHKDYHHIHIIAIIFEH